MKILNFVDVISNRVSRFNVLNTLDNEIQFLEDKVLPAIDKVIKTYPGKVDTNYGPMIANADALGRLKPGQGFTPLRSAVATYLKQAKLIASYSRDNLGDENILKDALTYRVVTILQYVETLNFVAKYTTRMVDGFLYNEYYRANKENIKKPSAYQVNMTEWLIRNRHNYQQALRLGLLNEKEVEESLADIPDKVINPRAYEMDVRSAQHGVTTLDPFGFGIITGTFSPIFLARDTYERARNAINESRKEDIASIELRLVYLKETKNGRQDPNLEERLENLAKRQKKLYLAVSEYEAELEE